jgi:hypothetical protein
MTKGWATGHIFSADCANPALLKGTIPSKADRPANDCRVKAISARMKDHHLCQDFICASGGEWRMSWVMLHWLLSEH